MEQLKGGVYKCVTLKGELEDWGKHILLPFGCTLCGMPTVDADKEKMVHLKHPNMAGNEWGDYVYPKNEDIHWLDESAFDELIKNNEQPQQESEDELWDEFAKAFVEYYPDEEAELKKQFTIKRK